MNIFFKELQNLAQEQSPTLLELVRCKQLDDHIEDVNDPSYLESAFTVISAHYIKAIDRGDVVFHCEEEKTQFLWTLRLITDVALKGELRDFLKNTKPELSLDTAVNRPHSHWRLRQQTVNPARKND